MAKTMDRWPKPLSLDSCLDTIFDKSDTSSYSALLEVATGLTSIPTSTSPSIYIAQAFLLCNHVCVKHSFDMKCLLYHCIPYVLF